MSSALKSELMKLKVAQLRARAAREGVEITGTKAKLVSRLLELHQEQKQENEKAEKGDQDDNQNQNQEKEEEEEEEEKNVSPVGNDMDDVVHTPSGPAVALVVSNMCLTTCMPREIEERVKWLLSHYGEVEDIQLIRDEDSERKYGSEAVVTMRDEAAANAACAALHMKYSLQTGSNAFLSVLRQDGVQTPMTDGKVGGGLTTIGLYRGKTQDGVEKSAHNRKKKKRKQEQEQQQQPAATHTTPAQISGVMPNSAPLPMSNAHSGGGDKRLQAKTVATPAGLFRGGDVPGLPPSASVDAKWAYLYT